MGGKIFALKQQTELPLGIFQTSAINGGIKLGDFPHSFNFIGNNQPQTETSFVEEQTMLS